LLPFLLTLFVFSSRGVSTVTFDTVSATRFIYKFSPLLGAALALSLFSLAGIPPFSGFFAKLYLFFGTILLQYYYVTALALLVSVASAVYYLKLVRMISIFKTFHVWLFLLEINRSTAYVISLSVLLNIFFFLVGGTLLSCLTFFSLINYV